jgi:ABC-2 type transport system ATP-binding protein
MEPREASRAARVAAAPLDPPLPPRWTVRTYVFWSVRLAGVRRAQARLLAAEAMGLLKIEQAADVEIGRTDLAVRRATVVAAALATRAELLLLEDPTSNLPDDAARTFARSIVQATEGRRTIVFAGRLPLASALATDADEAVVIAGSDVTAQGAPGELAGQERTVALRVHGDCEDFSRVARERGATVVGAGPLLRIDLGATLKVTDLLAVARETEAVVIEVHPVARAFA